MVLGKHFHSCMETVTKWKIRRHMKVSHRFFVSFLFIYGYLLDIFSYHLRGSLDDAAGKKKGDKRIGTFPASIIWANSVCVHNA